MTCFRCGKKLDALDIGAHRKLVLDEMIDRYRRWGCTLFPK